MRYFTAGIFKITGIIIAMHGVMEMAWTWKAIIACYVIAALMYGYGELLTEPEFEDTSESEFGSFE